MNWIDKVSQNHSIEFIMLTLFLSLLGLMRQNEFARLGLFLRAFKNSSLISQQVREEKAFNRIAIPLVILVVSVLSFFFAKTLHHFNYFSDWSFLSLFFSLSVLIIAVTALRSTIYFGLSVLFKLNYIHRAHTFHWLLNNFILALIILALNILYTFGPNMIDNTLIITGLIMIVALYLIRSFRLFTLFLAEARIPLLYNVLYLCALEFLPPTLVVMVVWRAGLG